MPVIASASISPTATANGRNAAGSPADRSPPSSWPRDWPTAFCATPGNSCPRPTGYVTRGIPWRRGYLLHGAPGTGKTSLVRALASELGLDLCIVNLTSSRLGDDGLATLMASAPPQAILLMEDIDAIFVGREKADAAPGLSFSGLLNAIDGVYAQEGRILVMTTNHKERLDPALIRPGRIDRHFEIGLAGEAEAVAMARAFYPDDPEMAPAVAKALAGRRITPAALQACLLAVESRPSAIGAEIERSLS